MCRSGASTSLQRPVVMAALAYPCASARRTGSERRRRKRRYQVNEIPHDMLHRLPHAGTRLVYNHENPRQSGRVARPFALARPEAMATCFEGSGVDQPGLIDVRSNVEA